MDFLLTMGFFSIERTDQKDFRTHIGTALQRATNAIISTNSKIELLPRPEGIFFDEKTITFVPGITKHHHLSLGDIVRVEYANYCFLFNKRDKLPSSDQRKELASVDAQVCGFFEVDGRFKSNGLKIKEVFCYLDNLSASIEKNKIFLFWPLGLAIQDK